VSERGCPKCGGNSGYYHVSIQRHVQSNYFTHDPMDCEIQFVRGGTRKYCSDCDRDITEYVAGLSPELGTYPP
jgi:hypothetical protein